jgi:UDP-glucose 4-epimerase
LAGKSEVRLGRLDPKRDLTYVSDTVEGFLRAGEVEGIEGEVIQLGTGRAISIGDLFDTACRVLGVTSKVVEERARFRPDASEVLVLQSDPSRARQRLNWEALVPLEDGLERTARWLESHLHLYDAERYHV